MKNIRVRLISTLAVTALFSPVINAQDARLKSGLTNNQFDSMFKRSMESIEKRREFPIHTPAHISERVSEHRLFITRERNVFRAEIELSAKADFSEFAVSLEDGTVMFRDDGQNADRRKSDGVFSALVKNINTKALAQRLSTSVKSTMEVASNGFDKSLIRLGPRNIVPIGPVIKELQSNRDISAASVQKSGDIILNIIEQEFSPQALQRADIDFQQVPLLRMPGAAFNSKVKINRIFDFDLFPIFPITPAIAVNQSASLMVTDTGVVEDPNRTFDACEGIGTQGGPWSFAHLMTEMAKGSSLTPEEFTLQWMSGWLIPQAPNGQPFSDPARGSRIEQQIIDTWDELDGTLDDNFDINLFPARLMAIVNRPDLADKIGYGTAGSAGEGRFVFGLMRKNGDNCSPVQFTVIFEYGIEGGSCNAVKSWHQRWVDLDDHAVGSAAYNTALEAITRDFTDFGGQASGESALNQLRTNEFLTAPWQLLEFRLNSSNTLALDTVKQTTDTDIDQSLTLQAYLESAESDVLSDVHVVPERFPTVLSPFMASHSDTPFQFIWHTSDPSSLTDHDETRRVFSLKTCNGCHAGETNTFFTHIGNSGTRAFGTEATLSDFLTGNNMPITVNPTNAPAINPTYNDLLERESALSDVVTRSCFSLLARPTLRFTH